MSNNSPEQHSEAPQEQWKDYLGRALEREDLDNMFDDNNRTILERLQDDGVEWKFDTSEFDTPEQRAADDAVRQNNANVNASRVNAYSEGFKPLAEKDWSQNTKTIGPKLGRLMIKVSDSTEQ